MLILYLFLKSLFNSQVLELGEEETQHTAYHTWRSPRQGARVLRPQPLLGFSLSGFFGKGSTGEQPE